jgi:hypothetical protein
MDSQNKIVFAVELGFTFTSLTLLKLVPSIALHSLRYYLLRLLRYKFVPRYKLRSVINRLGSRYRPPHFFLLIRRCFGLPRPPFPRRQSAFIPPLAPERPPTRIQPTLG